MFFGSTKDKDHWQRVIADIPPWRLIEVRWRDAYDAPNGWTEVSTYKPEDQIAQTVGYLWPDCQAEYVTLAATIFPAELPKPETVGNVTHIPLAWIQSVAMYS